MSHPFVRLSRPARRVALGGAWVALGLLLASCSDEAEEQATTPRTRTKYQTVMSVPWSTSLASFARQDAFDALPDGPRSFAIDTRGDLHVLDPIKRRISVFRKNKMLRYVSLPNEDFIDFDLDPEGGYVLLDTMERGEIVFINDKGGATSRVKLEGQGVDDVKLISAISRENSGVWIQLNQATWLHAATSDGKPTEQRALRRGKLVSKDGHMLQASLRPPTGFVVRKVHPTEGDKSVTVKAGKYVSAITGLEQDKAGNIYVGLWEIIPGKSPDAEQQEKHLLAVLSPTGKLLRYDNLPKPGPTQNSTRYIRRGQDGHLYALTVGTKGVTIARYTP